MADLSAGHSSHTPHVAWWRDERKRAILWQAVVIAVLLLVVAFIVINMIANLRTLGIPLGFDFLGATGGFAISFSLIPVDLDSTIGRLIVTGMLNTLLVSAISIVLATILGLLVGVMRLSRNYLVSRIATVYVETLRNVPLLVQLLFWYVAISKLFPNVRQAVNFWDTIFLSNRGIYTPRPVAEADFGIVFVALIIAVIGAVALRRWAKKRQEATGQQFPGILAGLGLIIVLPTLVGLALGSPVSWEIPELKGFNFQGGLVLQPELAALVLGLTTYTAAFISEIVRGGILAISHGQTEAALALGLKSRWNLRLVIIPQALRIIIPPMTSQYLNIAKNSTLAGIIGYPDLYSIIGTAQNQTGRAVENVAILMAFFLSLSLIISWLMNWYNRRIALVER
ncbi:MAG TPA: ABC transporter permease subunit [Dongiaceae bacterium]|nr:ABC transporter permease subunit [Dongiaceae bacterium]